MGAIAVWNVADLGRTKLLESCSPPYLGLTCMSECMLDLGDLGCLFWNASSNLVEGLIAPFPSPCLSCFLIVSMRLWLGWWCSIAERIGDWFKFGEGELAPPDIIEVANAFTKPFPLASFGESCPRRPPDLTRVFAISSSYSSSSFISSKMSCYCSVAVCGFTLCSSYFSIRFLIYGFEVICFARRPFESLMLRSTPFNSRIWQIGKYPLFAAICSADPLVSEFTWLTCVLLSSSKMFASWKNPLWIAISRGDQLSLPFRLGFTLL